MGARQAGNGLVVVLAPGQLVVGLRPRDSGERQVSLAALSALSQSAQGSRRRRQGTLDLHLGPIPRTTRPALEKGASEGPRKSH